MIPVTPFPYCQPRRNFLLSALIERSLHLEHSYIRDKYTNPKNTDAGQSKNEENRVQIDHFISPLIGPSICIFAGMVGATTPDGCDGITSSGAFLYFGLPTKA